MQVQATAAASERWRGERIVLLRRALVRTERGEFGRCDGCGEERAEGRLAIDPAITPCIACAR